MPYPLTRPPLAITTHRSVRSRAHEQAAVLLGRYPELEESELARLVGLFPRLSAVDMALMMADTELSPRLEAFCRTHRDMLRPSLADFAVIGAILSLPLVILLVVLITRWA